MDEKTLKQLKESNYHHPVITDVINDYKIMLEITMDGLNKCEIGYNTVWDAEMCKWASKYFVEGLELVRQRVREKGIKCRLITQVNLENINFLNPLSNFLEIRHLEGLRGNFGIYDERGYMAFILHKENNESLQTYFSTSKTLAEEQMQLFEELWEMAIPFAARKKELEYEDKKDTQRTITGFENIQKEIEALILTCKKDMTIFSSNSILCLLLNKYNFHTLLPSILQRGISIKILTVNVDEYLIKQIASINESFLLTKQIQIGFAKKVGDLDEMVMIFDDKHLLRLNYNQDNLLTAAFSNEEHAVMVQELMFEKYWNEVKSLEVMNSN
ncbi:hypothetical protein [Candidatus Nitrosocosmicus hydrocola]|uniref:hypothetical protein n=1 Tax=Candidatus Nitrosocosmicus hydrocola TaxID=1826872 RepID=UPI0011E5F441|nr:hypothetical protein [Candidatus Nitrosocosmicus hydrocola]